MDIRISIITICYNNLLELKKTLESIDIQIMKPFESIIIDGSTNTEISNWLNNSPQPNYRKWQCEKDQGIYDGFNKGVQLSTGDFLNFLNSGDIYSDQYGLEKVSNFIVNNPDIKWLSAKCFMEKFGSRVIMGDIFNPNLVYRGMRKINHQTCFFKKELFEKYGLFKFYKIGGDYDHIVRIFHEKYGFLNEVIIQFDMTGISNTNYFKGLNETVTIYESYHGFSFKSRWWRFRNKCIFYLLKIKFFQGMFTKKFGS
ncbi:MAG: glycosyltransferase [Sediminibacterium sp.]|nr:glycosyltransferase [Sediminibacterium sp.]